MLVRNLKVPIYAAKIRINGVLNVVYILGNKADSWTSFSDDLALVDAFVDCWASWAL